MKCRDCGKHMKPIFRDGNEYLYHECDICLAEICEDCCEVDDEGGCVCVMCLQQQGLVRAGIVGEDNKG